MGVRLGRGVGGCEAGADGAGQAGGLRRRAAEESGGVLEPQGKAPLLEGLLTSSAVGQIVHSWCAYPWCLYFPTMVALFPSYNLLSCSCQVQ